MNLQQLVLRVRSLTRDLSNSIFREVDVVDYVNEGIDRIAQVLPEFESMPYLSDAKENVVYLPRPYHHMLALYSASRCFAQDERHYQSTTLMNEFETKLEELKSNIESGDIVIKDPDGNAVEREYATDYVVDNYFYKKSASVDVDNGADEEDSTSTPTSEDTVVEQVIIRDGGTF